MSDLVPARPVRLAAPTLLAPLTDPAGGPALARLHGFFTQGAVRRALPWFLAVSAIGGAGLAWSVLAPAPQRLLYAQLDDGERAAVTAALDKGQIHYRIDPDSGALSVDEGDLYKARMLVAQNGALASPDTGGDALDKLPLGASRALEGERLRAAREHELMLTIKEIDGVEAARVEIAEGEQSVFVRDAVAPSASVMLRLADGRQLTPGQVNAIVNLVAGSVPGMNPAAVRVADQHGHLLSDRPADGDDDRLALQSRLEDKLRAQLNQLLGPMLGDGNFTSEVEVDLDMDQLTSARESYDKAGALRSETSQQSQGGGVPAAVGVPGVLSNTPPPAATPSPGAPTGTPAPSFSSSPPPSASPAPATGESAATRNYELGREVAVSTAAPGRIRRLSVAVALSAAAMKKYRPADLDQIRQLVSAAVGADPARGDQIAVVVRAFDRESPAPPPFYETTWFAMSLRYGAALVAVLLVLLLGIRPLAKAVRRASSTDAQAPGAGGDTEARLPLALADQPRGIDREALGRHVTMAQQLVETRPENAVLAIRQMLAPPEGGAAA
ncbi:MAG: flagellar M-ring protein FliF [Sphingomonadales bacterium]|nr:flagellar M-ring protein FliF [Sphingomonadales bacterium]